MKTYEQHWTAMSHIKSDDLLCTMLECHLEYCNDEIQLAALVDIITDKPTTHEMIVEEREPPISEEEAADHGDDN